LSTGPKTAEGIERIRRAVTKHGRYSAAAKLKGAERASRCRDTTRPLGALGPSKRRSGADWSTANAL
jgi:hypothetical protein